MGLTFDSPDMWDCLLTFYILFPTIKKARPPRKICCACNLSLPDSRTIDHSYSTMQMRYEKCNKLLFLLCTNVKDAFEEENQDNNHDAKQKNCRRSNDGLEEQEKTIPQKKK
eukprot:4633654-Ditylum_brightwellii.AAC.2